MLMTTPQEMLELADELARCPACPFGGSKSNLKFITGFAMTERKRELILTALRQAAQGREASPCAWTGYLPDENGILIRCWGFGSGPIDARDVRLLYSFPVAAAPQGEDTQ